MCANIRKVSGISYEVIKDPVYGYIALYEHEHDIINLPIFQRLRRIKQLPSAHYVYPGATHSRFSHSLGVMHLAGTFVQHLLEPYLFDEIPNEEFLEHYFLLRLWGLTHDIGHGPFSHAFDKVILEPKALSHEYLASRIVQEDPSIVKIFEEKLEDFDISPKKLAECLSKTREEWVSTKKLGRTDHTDAAFYQILKGFYSTDIIDYLLRDNLFSGAGYGNFDWQRLILSSCLYGDDIALDKKARDSLDALLISRLFSFQTIYYHRITRAVDHVITDFLCKVDKKLNFKEYTDDLRKYCELDEESILHDERLRSIPEAKMITNRELPYRSIYEERVTVPVSLKFMSEEDLSSLLSKKLGGTVPDNAYFVDTPNLPLNPMIGEEEVTIIDTSITPPAISREPIRRTSWGEIPYSIWMVRLYIHTKYRKHEKRLRNAFRSVIAEPKRTHF